MRRYGSHLGLRRLRPRRKLIRGRRHDTLPGELRPVDNGAACLYYADIGPRCGARVCVRITLTGVGLVETMV